MRSNIGALPIQSRWIVVRPKNIKELVVADLRRIEFHFDHLSVSGLVCANIFIGRIIFRSARVAGHYVRYAVDLPERRFNSPKTSRTECRFLCHSVIIKQDWLRRNTLPGRHPDPAVPGEGPRTDWLRFQRDLCDRNFEREVYAELPDMRG